MELAYTGNEIIKSLYEALGKSKNRIDGFGYVKEFKENDSSINFLFLNSKICIESKVCTSKEEGFIEWYLDQKDFLDSKTPKILIIKDSFDRNFYIKASTEAEKEYHKNHANNYFIKTLATFCKKIDEITLNKKVN
jgi:hypothetical protein